MQELVAEFGFHPYAMFRPEPWRERRSERRGDLLVAELMLAGKEGDLAAVRGHLLAGRDCDVTDYDGRTVLHVAAAEGHLALVHMLLERCGFLAAVQDRYGDRQRAAGCWVRIRVVTKSCLHLRQSIEE